MKISENDTVLDYKRASRNSKIIVGKEAKNFLPNPSSDDYERGYIIRYFAKQRNNPDGIITEIDKQQFDSHADVSGGLQFNFYTVISLRWKITGGFDEIQVSNFNILADAEKKMKGILRKIGNLLQFAKLV